MIQKERIKQLKEVGSRDGEFVLYWMQASQRSVNNHALEYTAKRAKDLEQPLVVFFVLTNSFPEANRRHYVFMLQGLKEVRANLNDRGVQFITRQGDPVNLVPEVTKDASELVTDRGYLNVQKEWRKKVKEKINCPMTQVETDIVVPVEVASDKEEYAARTIRPKIQSKIDKYLNLPDEVKLKESSLDLEFNSIDLENPKDIVGDLDVNQDIKEVEEFKGGRSEALDRIDRFLEGKIERYPEESNDPNKDVLSGLSPYLHFGQISPVYVAKRVKERGGKGSEEFLEELIVRRELAINFIHYSKDYRSLDCLPDWARETLEKHRDDEREYVYSEEEFENAETHDPYWNAAQRQMVETGKMHGYMRMYWGKKILEWTDTPEEGFRIALKLNNKYELDGRDPNGFTGVAWCFGKHDQGWKERPVYGKVRYMNANGLNRKFDADRYTEKWS